MSDDALQPRRRGLGWKSAWWFLAVFGSIATVLGFVILVGGEDVYVGLGGDLAWPVRDISSAWAFGLLIGGIVLLAGVVGMTILGRRMGPVTTTPVQDLMFHAGVFVLVNAFIWAQDLALGGGLNYAQWVTIPWGVGLMIHAVAVFRARSVLTPEHRAGDGTGHHR